MNKTLIVNTHTTGSYNTDVRCLGQSSAISKVFTSGSSPDASIYPPIHQPTYIENLPETSLKDGIIFILPPSNRGLNKIGKDIVSKGLENKYQPITTRIKDKAPLIKSNSVKIDTSSVTKSKAKHNNTRSASR